MKRGTGVLLLFVTYSSYALNSTSHGIGERNDLRRSASRRIGVISAKVLKCRQPRRKVHATQDALRTLVLGVSSFLAESDRPSAIESLIDYSYEVSRLVAGEGGEGHQHWPKIESFLGKADGRRGIGFLRS